MKKVLIAAGALLIVGLMALYVFIPSSLRIAEAAKVKANFSASRRFLLDQHNWSAWAPATTGQYRSTINNTFYSTTNIIIADGNDQYNTSLRLVPFGIDSTGIQWDYAMPTGNNPFTRLGQYNKALRLKSHMDSMMTAMVKFLNSSKSIYGTLIEKEQLRDRPLLSRRITMNRPPVAADTYRLLDEVEKYAKLQGDSAIAPAMKYSSKIDSTTYELMVAIPTQRMLAGNADFVAKGLVGGNLITTAVTGGEEAIRKGWKGLEQYKADFRLASPAIPFEMMITDRRKEPDSSKWITRIYYPIRF